MRISDWSSDVCSSDLRALSMILPLLALLLLSYAYFGPYLPGDLFSHQGFTVSQIVGDIYASMNGIFGFVAYVFIAFVMLFVIMGEIGRASCRERVCQYV